MCQDMCGEKIDSMKETDQKQQKQQNKSSQKQNIYTKSLLLEKIKKSKSNIPKTKKTHTSKKKTLFKITTLNRTIQSHQRGAILSPCTIYDEMKIDKAHEHMLYRLFIGRTLTTTFTAPMSAAIFQTWFISLLIILQFDYRLSYPSTIGRG